MSTFKMTLVAKVVWSQRDALDFPRGSDARVGSGLRGSGSYVDLRRPVIALRIVLPIVLHVLRIVSYSAVITDFTEDIELHHSSADK